MPEIRCSHSTSRFRRAAKDKYVVKDERTAKALWWNPSTKAMAPEKYDRLFKPEFTIIHAPSFMALPDEDGVERETFVAMNLEKMEVLIGGTAYAGERMPIEYSRAVVRGALSGKLKDRPTRTDPYFGFEVPTECEGVPADVLDAKKTWADGAAYDEKAKALAESFKENFKEYAEVAPKEVLAAGPK